jgi:4-hydroxy-2-oxoheptanedioate aldolase
MDPIRPRLLRGEPALGAWVSLGDGLCIDIMAKSGYDFLVLDTQHGAITWEKLLPAMQILGADVPALVRVGACDAAQIMRAVDLGAAGVIVPMVSSAADAQLAAQAVRYPPKGNRSFGPIRDYYAASAGQVEPLCFVMIETVEGMHNVDAIAATAGIDGLFLGPVDLSLSLGLGISMTMPHAVLDAVEQLVAVCQRHGIIAGSASLGMANAEVLLRRGVRFMTLGSDAAHLRRGAHAEVEQGRALKKMEFMHPASAAGLPERSR